MLGGALTRVVNDGQGDPSMRRPRRGAYCDGFIVNSISQLCIRKHLNKMAGRWAGVVIVHCQSKHSRVEVRAVPNSLILSESLVAEVS